VTLIAASLVQVDPALLEQIGRIATAQTVMMVIMGLLFLMMVGAALLSFNTMKQIGRTLDAMEKVIDELAPRAEPLIDGATRVAVDAAAITESVRRKVGDVLDTVEDVNGHLRTAIDIAEERLQRLNAVLEVVQTETEDALLGAASTARGVSEAARALRRPSSRRPERSLPQPDLDLDADE
jgi:uncharacterized protein YoxC